MELGSYSNRDGQRDPLTGNARPSAFTGISTERVLSSAFGGSGWGGDCHVGPDQSMMFSPYQVNYEGVVPNESSPRDTRMKTSTVIIFAILICTVFVGGIAIFRSPSLVTTVPPSSTYCDVSRSSECTSFAYPQGFAPERLRLVTANLATNSYLFRSSLLLKRGGTGLAIDELTQAVQSQLETNSLADPQSFVLKVYSSQWDEPNGSMNEKCEIGREFCFFVTNDSIGSHVVHWPIYGEGVNPYDLPEDVRNDYASNMKSWCADDLDNRIDALHQNVEHPDEVTASKPEYPPLETAPKAQATLFRAADGTDDEKGSPRLANVSNPSGNNMRRRDAANSMKQECMHCVGGKQCSECEGNNETVRGSSGEQMRLNHMPKGKNDKKDSMEHDEHKARMNRMKTKDEAVATDSDKTAVDSDTQAPSRDLAAVSTSPALITIIHGHDGIDRTGLLVGAYRMKYLGASLELVWKDNKALSMDVFETVNSLMWYCLYLEIALKYTTTRCYDIYSAYADMAFMANGKGLVNIPFPYSQPPDPQPLNREKPSSRPPSNSTPGPPRITPSIPSQPQPVSKPLNPITPSIIQNTPISTNVPSTVETPAINSPESLPSSTNSSDTNTNNILPVSNIPTIDTTNTSSSTSSSSQSSQIANASPYQEVNSIPLPSSYPTATVPLPQSSSPPTPTTAPSSTSPSLLNSGVPVPSFPSTLPPISSTPLKASNTSNTAVPSTTPLVYPSSPSVTSLPTSSVKVATTPASASSLPDPPSSRQSQSSIISPNDDSTNNTIKENRSDAGGGR